MQSKSEAGGFYLLGSTTRDFLQAQALAVLHPGRGAAHQELQVAAVADVAQLQQRRAPPADRDAASEQPHGALVPNALLDAGRVPGESSGAAVWITN